jgi:phage tail sheath protein FI|tara:strand:+ start:7150 stop:9108 length:1959 start_codon:yes stop_codon:yes gene_type:complete
MAFSVSPSVIVREVDASQAVPGVATAPAAIAGIFKWGPTNDPILITSENQLVDRFGTPTDDNYETFFTATDYLSYSNALYVARADDGSLTASGTTEVLDANNNVIAEDSTYAAFDAKYAGALGNSIEVSWATAGSFTDTVAAVGDIENNGISNNSVTQTIDFNASALTFETANTVAAPSVYVGDVLVIGNSSVGFQELTVATVASTDIDEEFGSGNTAVTATVGTTTELTFNTRYTLAETSLNKLSIVKKWQYNSTFGKAPATGNIHVAVIDKDGLISGTPNEVLEVFDNLSTTAGSVDPQGASNFYETVIENSSSWIKVANTAVVTAAMTNEDSVGTEKLNQYERMAGGTDASTESSATLSSLAFAWDTFKNTNEIDISFILQGKGDDLGVRANYIISNVADYRRDCVAFISPSKEAVVDELKTNSKMENAIAYRNKIQNSSYAFIDSGYKYRYDKYNDKYRWTPLNGDMAGLSARVDPWESPAGYRKGIIKNIVKLAFNPSKPQRDVLYSSDVNPVMSQAGRGIVLFGDKTGLGINSAFDRLNVRRLFIAVEKSIATAAESFLFEFNDDFTQTQFKNIVDPFLRDIQGRRGIIDYRVVSDASVNTPEVVDANKFRASIFIKPARSINVIELTFVATRTGVEFDEIVGQIA